MAEAMVILFKQLELTAATLQQHLVNIELVLTRDLHALSPELISLLVDRQCQIEEALQRIHVCKTHLISPPSSTQHV